MNENFFGLTESEISDLKKAVEGICLLCEGGSEGDLG